MTMTIYESFAGRIRRITKSAFLPKARCFGSVRSALRGGHGLEIGGPSRIFGDAGGLPIYCELMNLDNCVFSTTTVWEGEQQSGRTFKFHGSKPNGWNYIQEGSVLGSIAKCTYDFVLSSHNIEHFANPLKALFEWKRVLKDFGFLLLVLPNRQNTFDHRRPVTLLSHIIEDFEAGTTEDDLTHLPEIIRLHDLGRDPHAIAFERFRDRALKNSENRCLHHHVFDLQLAISLTEYAGFEVLAAELYFPIKPQNIIVFARKTGTFSLADPEGAL